MNNLIKIVYDWIGPRGPMSNTEVPNILQLTAVAFGTRPESHKFWTDDIWNKLFQQNSKFQMSSSFTIDRNDEFIFPFNLAWRIPFDHYFLAGSGILEFGHTPSHIIHHVRNHKGYFLLEMGAEAFVQDQHLSLLHSYFGIGNSIPMSKIIYVTGCMNAQEIYENFCNRHNISNNPRDRMNVISFPISQFGLTRALNNPGYKECIYDPNKIPEKLFLSWNRRLRNHRTGLIISLDKIGLVDRSYISAGKVDPENSLIKFEDRIDQFELNRRGITQEDISALVNKLPLVIDGETNNNQMCQDFNNAAREFYVNSLISLVTETNFIESELTLTEKAFKPFKEKHPFIILAVSGALKVLRDMGFKTFGEFWSESYDEIRDHRQRFDEIIRLCKEISEWDQDKILDFRKRVQPIVEHNYLNLKNGPGKSVSEQSYQIVKGTKMKKVLVCGAGGFIGCHLVESLKQHGYHVIGVDLKNPSYSISRADDFRIVDLRDRSQVANLITSDIDEIYQLAADMGGAGYIFTGEHDADIMHNSTLINLNILDEMRVKGVKKILYTSSACVYPEHNQLDPSNPNCEESSAYPANPDSDYGWEKLFSERLYSAYNRNYGIDVRIARFHNVFGPLGSWNNGKEKAPAALCRKILQSNGLIDIWGDGTQTRSFLYIDDAIEGIHKIMAGEYTNPINLGSNRMISINDLARLIANIAGKEITINHISGPIGVMGRTSDNTLIYKLLNWKPHDNLEKGLMSTYNWIKSQMDVA